ncbi:MAG: YggS family pyridoxal phosphate-dependent enzyme [Verrucomicrobiia bacterium]
MDEAVELAERYRVVTGRVAAACARAGRSTDSVTLVAVTKTHPPEAADALARLGQLDVGENKVQEAKAKVPLCNGRLRWHGIGHLQTNKARDAVRLFCMLHSVDSVRLAEELEKQAAAQGKRLPVFLEVNVSGEGSKFGLKSGEVAEAALAVNRLPHLELRGLMTMPPWSEDPETARPFFRQLAVLRREVETRLGAPLPDLSMGMSGDFEVAIEEGATFVRVGTALLGERRARRMAIPVED